jgi:hypothetical protein
MSKATTDVLLWAKRVIGRANQTPYDLLEIPKGSSLEVAQAAFHKIAKLSHPDMHRTTLDAAEFESVTFAYATVAAAYQSLRNKSRGVQEPPPPTAIDAPSHLVRTKRPSHGPGVRLPGGGVVGAHPPRSTTHPPDTKAAGPAQRTSSPAIPMRPSSPVLPTRGSSPAITGPGGDGIAPPTSPPSQPLVDSPTSPPRGAMSSKALVYYRKAEFALKGGDLRGALLNLRLAIAADPSSPLLRNAIAEVEAELAAQT